MPIKPDSLDANADWTKAYVYDRPGYTAEMLAQEMFENGEPIDSLTGKPMYDNWLVLQPWLADVGPILARLIKDERAKARKLGLGPK